MRRRTIIIGGLTVPVLGRAGRAQPLAPTPACDDGPTPPQTEGPFWTPRSPERTSLLEADVPGEPMVLAGLVLDTECRPVAGAVVDLWQADGSGRYDNQGFRLRGHQRTDPQGRFRFATVRPGRYTGRTPHFHLKVQAPGGPVLTTQLYLPGEPQNARDRLFDPRLLVALDPAAEVPAARFDLVVRR